MVKMNSDGLALQEKLRSSISSRVSMGKVSMAAKKESSLTKSSSTCTDELKEKEVMIANSVPFKIGKTQIPIELTDILGKDWDFVNRKHFLQKLPSSISAFDVLVEFRKVYRKKKIVGLGVFDQFIEGLNKVLDAYIGRGLLYRFERPQLLSIFENRGEVSLSKIYGPIVLIRYLRKKLFA